MKCWYDSKAPHIGGAFLLLYVGCTHLIDVTIVCDTSHDFFEWYISYSEYESVKEHSSDDKPEIVVVYKWSDVVRISPYASCDDDDASHEKREIFP